MDFEKSMKYTNKKRTICEVVRECNDEINKLLPELSVFDHAYDSSFRLKEKLKEIHDMAKRMTHKLYDYSKKWDKDFWEANPDYEEDLKRRLSE